MPVTIALRRSLLARVDKLVKMKAGNNPPNRSEFIAELLVDALDQ